VDHFYLFGLTYLNAHYSGNGPYQALYDEIDNKRLARLHIYGTPPPIVDCNGAPALRVILPDYILLWIWSKTVHPLSTTVALPLYGYWWDRMGSSPT